MATLHLHKASQNSSRHATQSKYLTKLKDLYNNSYIHTYGDRTCVFSYIPASSFRLYNTENATT